MAKSLVIVESPAKAKTIEKYLGGEYKVRASYGHVRDLPLKKLGVDVKHEFEPEYIIPPKAKKVVAQLKEDASSAPSIYLATDFDREGEAIAWHVVSALGLDAKRPHFLIGGNIIGKDMLNYENQFIAESFSLLLSEVMI